SGGDARDAVGDASIQLADDDALELTAALDDTGLHSGDADTRDSAEYRGAWNAGIDKPVRRLNAVQKREYGGSLCGNLFDHRTDGVQRVALDGQNSEVGGAQLVDAIGGAD